MIYFVLFFKLALPTSYLRRLNLVKLHLLTSYLRMVNLVKLPLLTSYLRMVSLVKFAFPELYLGDRIVSGVKNFGTMFEPVLILIQHLNILVIKYGGYLLLFHFVEDLFIFMFVCDVVICSEIFVNHLKKCNSDISFGNVLWTSILNFVIDSVTELLWVASGNIPMLILKKLMILILYNLKTYFFGIGS